MVSVAKPKEKIESTKTTAKPTQQNHKWEKKEKKSVEKERKMEWHAIHSTSENILLFTSLRQKGTTTMAKNKQIFFSTFTRDKHDKLVLSNTMLHIFSEIQSTAL